MILGAPDRVNIPCLIMQCKWRSTFNCISHLNERLNKLNTRVKNIFIKCHIQQKKDVYIWYMVASWACEVTLILTQKMLLHCFFVSSVTSQAQFATITPSYFCV